MHRHHMRRHGVLHANDVFGARFQIILCNFSKYDSLDDISNKLYMRIQFVRVQHVYRYHVLENDTQLIQQNNLH